MNSNINVLQKLPILIVGDIIDSYIDSEMSLINADNPTKLEVNEIIFWFKQAGYQVLVLNSVHDFIANVSLYKDFIVFPLWRGGYSRNRTSIVPAVCEESEILYIGSDAFVQAVCQDKSISKYCCKKAGIDVPNDLVIYSLEDLDHISLEVYFESRFVIKPLFSACSIGIDHNSLCFNDFDGKEKINELFMLGLGPVICEEFIVGDEISLCFLEEKGRVTQRCVSSFTDVNGNCPFFDKLYTFEDKMRSNSMWTITDRTSLVDDNLWNSIELLIRQLGKVDYMRVDGKLRNNKFIMIELTPDINLSADSAFISTFKSMGISPVTIIDKIVETALRNYYI